MAVQASQARAQLSIPEFREAMCQWLTPTEPPPVLDELLAGLPVSPGLRGIEPWGKP
jgi:hypothetical protein